MHEHQDNARKIKVLPENRMEALRDLHINPTHKARRDESPVFLLYLNYAVNTICDIAGINQNTSSAGVENAILQRESKSPQVIYKLANFFWLFAVKTADPEKAFPNYKAFTLLLVKKIYELRDYFAHLNKSGSSPLSVDTELYRFIGGVLYSSALESVAHPGLKTAKLFKMKLFAARDKAAGTYEFTRRGLIFLICLSLYRDDAYEFTQCLEDMKLPQCAKGAEDSLECDCNCEDIAVCKPGVARAFVKMFTFFSARRGRSVNLLEDDLAYMSFADITGYLNKVPAVSMDYLALEKESAMLQEKSEKSTESEKNKKYKYSLHKRHQNRFLSFAAGYCEDFDILPCLKFKRQDISNNEGRKRYFFGKENDNRVHMDRHYQIRQNTINFAWFPKKHYGDIHIDSLRSAICSSALKDLLYASFSGKKIDKAVDAYFSAYHRILETILNTAEPDDIYLEGELLKDFAIVSNTENPDELLEDVTPLERYFSTNLLRFLTRDDSLPDSAELKERLEKCLGNLIVHAEDFITRLNKFKEWQSELLELRKKDPEARLPKPVCTGTDVKNPPRKCEFSDAELIRWVFNYFNLYLTDEQKFRQLPPGEQHRGPVDFEYQTVHALIGKYALDPKGLKYYIEKKKTELLPAWERLGKSLKNIQKRAASNMPPKFNKWGKQVLPPVSLQMLAEASAASYIEYCEKKLQLVRQDAVKDIKALCRKFKIRSGMPLDRASLIKTVLRIDLSKWLNAYDYENNSKYENRSLSDAGHAVSQVPFPKDFAQRLMFVGENAKSSAFVRELDDKKRYFDFNAAVSQMESEVTLRDFYDTTPLVAASNMLKTRSEWPDVSGLRTVWQEGEQIDLSRSAVKNAINSIKESRNQDKLLVKIALAYWNKFNANGAFECFAKKSSLKFEGTAVSIYEYFDAAVVQLKFLTDDRKIVLKPNDVNRPILSQIQANAAEIAKVMDPEGTQQSFEFYEMMKTYRVIQAMDRSVRFAVIPLMAVFEQSVNIPEENYVKGADNRSMEFEYFNKKYPNLTRQEYDKMVDLRNAVYHRGINLQMNGVDVILKKYVSLPSPLTGGDKAKQKKYYPKWKGGFYSK